MSSALSLAGMTREAFLAWQPPDDRRYEFDGFAPVSMTDGTRDHARIAGNVQTALQTRLRGSPCEALSQDAGIATLGDAVRFPDVLVTCTRGAGSDLLIPDPVAVFEVLSASSGRTDRIDKLREYRAVSSIRQYVILESRSGALTLLEREAGVQDWTARSLVIGDVLSMPALGIDVPVSEFYERVDLPAQERAAASDIGTV